MPGFIKNVGDHIRMRWVQPGYDPDATDVPPNKVIFDSDDIAMLSVLERGTVSLSTGEHGSHSSGSITSYEQIVSWDLPYVPLCQFMWDFGTGYLVSCYNVAASETMINVRKTGVYLWAIMPLAATLHYTAFNAKAADG